MEIEKCPKCGEAKKVKSQCKCTHKGRIKKRCENCGGIGRDKQPFSHLCKSCVLYPEGEVTHTEDELVDIERAKQLPPVPEMSKREVNNFNDRMKKNQISFASWWSKEFGAVPWHGTRFRKGIYMLMNDTTWKKRK